MAGYRMYLSGHEDAVLSIKIPTSPAFLPGVNAQILFQKGETALLRQFVSLLVECRPLRAPKAVPRAVIDINFNLRMRRANGAHVCMRDAGIGFTKMELNGAT